MRSKPRQVLWLAALICFAQPTARGQGIIIDRRPHFPLTRTFEVREVAIDARVREQVAEVRVSQTFHNPGSIQLEAEYCFPMPDDGAIQDFVLMVDGRELPGKLLPKDEARQIYENIVRTKRDPALLEYMGRGMFKTSVFPIPPGAERKVTLRYTQLCRRDRDVVEFAYPLATQKFTSKPIQRLALRLDIDSRDPIKSVYCPSHDAEIHRSGDHHADVKLVQHDVVPDSDFKLVYTLSGGSLGASVLSYRPSESDDGYFLLLASPQVEKPDSRPRSKTVVFVLDRSGSMSGKKIEQARNALKFVLDNLRDGDTFNIVAYDDRVETFRPELQRYSSEMRSEAVRWVENIQPGGSTNIDDALKTSLAMLRDDSRPEYILFLTDGLPTAGQTREGAIAEDARHANSSHARIFSFGVGFDVNARLLDRISGENGGVTEYVRPDEDIERNVSRFYSKFTSPVLTGVSITFDGTDVNRTYPRDVPDLFEGGQLVWVGRYHRSGRTEVTIAGKIDGERRTVRFDADLARTGQGSSYDFVERLWAVRRVGFLIDQIDLHGSDKELTEELVSLSAKYGILTPYTSFLADEGTRLDRVLGMHQRGAVDGRLVQEAEKRLEQLNRVEGQLGVGQRANKQAYLNADRDLGAGADAMFARKKAAANGYGGMMGMGGMGGRAAGAAAAAGPAPSLSGLAQRQFRAGRPRGLPAAEAPPAANATVSAPALGAKAALAQDEAGNTVAVANVRQLGRKTFYRRDGRWIDSEVKADDEAKARVIPQFSDDFFELARTQGPDLNQYLTFDEPVTVKLGEVVYRIERARD